MNIPTYGKDGGFIWGVTWKLKGDADVDNGGYVVQNVKVTFNVTNVATGKRMSIRDIINDDKVFDQFKGYMVDDYTLDYWEAWRIDPRKTMPSKGKN